MPEKKHNSRKNVATIKKDHSPIPKQKSMSLDSNKTSVEPKKRVTAITTAGKKKKPK